MLLVCAYHLPLSILFLLVIVIVVRFVGKTFVCRLLLVLESDNYDTSYLFGVLMSVVEQLI